MTWRLGRWPLVLFLALSAVLVGSWWLLQRREGQALQASLDQTSRHVASGLVTRVGSQLDQLVQLGQGLLLELGEDDVLDEARFRRASRDHQRRHPGLAALNWVEPGGVIRWVEPEPPNRGALGFDLSEHPTAGDIFRRALVSAEPVVTPPLELLQGGWGLAAYQRLERDGRVLGLLNAVFRLPDLLQQCLDPGSSERFAYQLRRGDELLGALGTLPAHVERLPSGDTPLELAGQHLVLSAVPAPRGLVAADTWVDEVLLAMAVLLAAGLACWVRVAQQGRARAEEASARVGVLVDNAPDALVVVDGEGRLRQGNSRAEALLGAPLDELSGRRLAEWVQAPEAAPGDEASGPEPQLARARAGEAPDVEWTLRRPDGRELPVHARLVRLPARRGVELLVTLTDITERRRLEQDLRRAQAHAAMGRMAGGVAHDFNNLLTAILGSAEMLGERTRDDPLAQELVRTSLAACERAGDLTGQLLAFSRHSTVVPRPLDLGAVVAGLVPVLERVLGERVRIETRLEATRPVRADPSQLELALLNLAVNARDAMPAGGLLRVSTRDEGDDAVCLDVADQGEGIPPEVLGHIFEPFFTTKGPDLGTGIGLATVKEIVQRADGTLGVHSELGGGTTFSARFPACQEAPAAPPAAPPTAAPPRGDARVLLVEDDPGVRDALARTLEQAGYGVVAAGTAERGLELLEGGDPAVDLLVSDVMLPGASGLELVRRARARRPELPALLLSGYSEVALAPDGDLPPGVRFLAKPFAPSELLERLAACRSLGAPGPA